MDLWFFLSSYSREAREIALSLRTLVLDVFPGAMEQVDSKSKIIAYYLEKSNKSLVCAISPHFKYVNLIFANGTQISDPTNLLFGTGKCVRHVKITSESETINPELRKLLMQAWKLSY